MSIKSEEKGLVKKMKTITQTKCIQMHESTGKLESVESVWSMQLKYRKCCIKIVKHWLRNVWHCQKYVIILCECTTLHEKSSHVITKFMRSDST